MSFPFKTGAAGSRKLLAMDKTSPAACPRPSAPSAPPATGPVNTGWPPGPPSGLTGWGLMVRMARDLLGALAGWQQTYGDIYHLRLWPEHEIVVTDPELVRALLVTHHDRLIRWERGTQVFEQLHGQSVFTSEGEAWKAKRQALQPSFSPRAAQDFVPTIAATVAAGVQAWPQRQALWPIERAVTALTMDVILRLMFSSPAGEETAAAAEAVHTVSAEANKEFYWPVSLPDWLPWKAAKRRAFNVLTGLIDRHVQSRLNQAPDAWPPDLLSHLLTLHRDQPGAWPLRAVRDECMTAFVAGHETVAATLTWWAWCLAAHPEIQATARAEVGAALGDQPPTAAKLANLPFLTQTLHETLRLYPAAPMLLARRARARSSPTSPQGATPRADDATNEAVRGSGGPRRPVGATTREARAERSSRGRSRGQLGVQVPMSRVHSAMPCSAVAGL